tara:strand:+ start:3449 stop:3985 length:537 start_codon:yes stop_codon:yes gene_type:complete
MSTIRRLLKNKILRVAVMLTVLLLPFTADYRFVIVDGDSMYPTYKDRELVVEERISSLGKGWKPKVGDVIVVVDETGDKLIKRVVAVPGDLVKIRNGDIYVNEKKYQDSYTHIKIGILLVGADGVALRNWKTGEFVYEYIPKDFTRLNRGEYWVIGDNRSMTWHGVVKIEEVEGKVLY